MNLRFAKTQTASVPNATQVKPGVYVANASTSIFRTSDSKK